MDTASSIFVVEDDPELRTMLSAYLERQGLAVTVMANGYECLRRVARLRPDLIVLDVGLPDISGLAVCQQLRASGDQIPIILLTARSEEVDRVVGLEMGADDYLGKPFSARELLARIHAVLRRTNLIPGQPKLGESPIQIGEFELDLESRCLYMNDETRVLSTVEYAMLAALVTNPRLPQSRERLLEASHTGRETVLLRTVDVTIMRLRKLLEPDPSEPRYIQTVRGHGYMFVPMRAER